MLKIHIINKIALRFRRWSRNGYAVFFSLGKCVSIGNLKKNISDASLPKTKVAPLSTTMSNEKEPILDGLGDFDLILFLMEFFNLNNLQASALMKLADATYNKYGYNNNKVAYCFIGLK